MNIFIIGPSRSAKTPIANLVAKELETTSISASAWVRSQYKPSKPIETIEDKQKALEEITKLSGKLLQQNPNACLDYIRNNYPNICHPCNYHRICYVLEGFRNPRDFLSLFNHRYDLVVFLRLFDAVLHPLLFETEGLKIIKDSISWMIDNSLLDRKQYEEFSIQEPFDQVETVAASIVNKARELSNARSC